MNEPQATKQPPPAPKQPERTPRIIERLIFISPNPAGVKLPDGPDGKGERIIPFLNAGENGGVKIEIEHRPWLRRFFVTKSKKVSRTDKGIEVVSWEPMGKRFDIPDDWAVAVPVDE